ncbi:cupin domain-containing protein [soil metagenome]
MSASLISVSKTTVELRPAPIPSSWIIAGDPVAESSVLSKSNDRTASTIVWQCSKGEFNWYYDVDETIYILEGSIVIESATMKPTKFGPGDVIFFKHGSQARWLVEDHVRKLAFCRRTLPSTLGMMLRIVSKVKRVLLPNARPSAPLLDHA